MDYLGLFVGRGAIGIELDGRRAGFGIFALDIKITAGGCVLAMDREVT